MTAAASAKMGDVTDGSTMHLAGGPDLAPPKAPKAPKSPPKAPKSPPKAPGPAAPTAFPGPGAGAPDDATSRVGGGRTRRGERKSAFTPMEDVGSPEPTPALLAARAEPLADSGPSARPRTGDGPRAAALGGDGPRRSSGSASGGPTNSRRQVRRKPKEPPKLLIGLGVAGILLFGALAAFFLTRGGDDSETATGLEDAAVTDTTVEDVAGPTDDLATTDSTVAEAVELPPVVIFDEAAVGPVQSGQPYKVAVGDGPADSQVRLIVDDEPVTEFAPELPEVTFTPGRHLLVIEAQSGGTTVATDPVVIYAVGELPPVSYRANLSSVDMQAEGWAEAIRQFDEYTAAGHTELELMPSDWFADLPTGYWNIFVGGFQSATEASEYCEQFGLAQPDDCFPRRVDPDAVPESE
ncbi:MAG: hypothetical protein AAF467_11890 [Actinomycetota bacterium]